MIPVGETHRDGGRTSCANALDEGVPREVDERDETLSKRIRDAELEKVPYVVVYGDRESDESLAVRERGGGQSTRSLDELRCGRFRRGLLRSDACQAGADPPLTSRTRARGGSTESKTTRNPGRCLQRLSCRTDERKDQLELGESL